MEAHVAGAALQPGQLAVGGADDAVADEARLHTLKLLLRGGVGTVTVTVTVTAGTRKLEREGKGRERAGGEGG